MAKYNGKVGYSINVETRRGVYKPSIVEKKQYGDVIRSMNSWQSSSNGTIDNLNVSNQISIVANNFAKKNFHSMVYAEFEGTLWKITKVDVIYPRLILTLGGVYNGQQPELADNV